MILIRRSSVTLLPPNLSFGGACVLKSIIGSVCVLDLGALLLKFMVEHMVPDSLIIPFNGRLTSSDCRDAASDGVTGRRLE